MPVYVYVYYAKCMSMRIGATRTKDIMIYDDEPWSIYVMELERDGMRRSDGRRDYPDDSGCGHSRLEELK